MEKIKNAIEKFIDEYIFMALAFVMLAVSFYVNVTDGSVKEYVVSNVGFWSCLILSNINMVRLQLKKPSR